MKKNCLLLGVLGAMVLSSCANHPARETVSYEDFLDVMQKAVDVEKKELKYFEVTLQSVTYGPISFATEVYQDGYFSVRLNGADDIAGCGYAKDETWNDGVMLVPESKVTKWDSADFYLMFSGFFAVFPATYIAASMELPRRFYSENRPSVSREGDVYSSEIDSTGGGHIQTRFRLNANGRIASLCITSSHQEASPQPAESQWLVPEYGARAAVPQSILDLFVDIPDSF